LTFKVDQGIDDAAWKAAEEGMDEGDDEHSGYALFEVTE
jgi:hypothetical protein